MQIMLIVGQCSIWADFTVHYNKFYCKILIVVHDKVCLSIILFHGWHDLQGKFRKGSLRECIMKSSFYVEKVSRWKNYHCKIAEMNLILGMHRKHPCILMIL